MDTFPKLLMRHAEERGARPAIREKDLGIWQTWTWRQFADEVRMIAAALAAEGFRRGEHIALVGDNRAVPALLRGGALKAAHDGEEGTAVVAVASVAEPEQP